MTARGPAHHGRDPESSAPLAFVEGADALQPIRAHNRAPVRLHHGRDGLLYRLPSPILTARQALARPSRQLSCGTDLVTSVAGSVVGRNLASVNRAPGEAPRPAVAPSATTPLRQFLQ